MVDIQKVYIFKLLSTFENMYWCLHAPKLQKFIKKIIKRLCVIIYSFHCFQETPCTWKARCSRACTEPTKALVPTGEQFVSVESGQTPANATWSMKTQICTYMKYLRIYFIMTCCNSKSQTSNIRCDLDYQTSI